MFEINSLLLELTHSKSAVYVLNGILLSFLALSGAQWSGFYMDRINNGSPSSLQTAKSGRSTVGFNVDELIASNIFGTADKSTAPAQANIPLSSLNLKLTGVIASDRGGFALISVNGQPQTPYFIGEVIIENALLDSVLPDRAILLRGGVKESLVLDDGLKQELTTRQRPGTQRSKPALHRNFLKKNNGNRFQAIRDKARKQANNSDWMRQALIVPNPQGGFVVKNIKPGSVIEKLGLRKGDVLRKVNNIKIKSRVDIIQLYRLTKDINQAQKVRIEVTRNGRQQILQHNLY